MASKENISGILDDDIKYPFVLMGHTFYEGGRAVCNKCGNETGVGIIPIAIHWNECIDENKTFNAIMSARKEKGSELTIDDLDKILPKKPLIP